MKLKKLLLLGIGLILSLYSCDNDSVLKDSEGVVVHESFGSSSYKSFYDNDGNIYRREITTIDTSTNIIETYTYNKNGQISELNYYQNGVNKFYYDGSLISSVEKYSLNNELIGRGTYEIKDQQYQYGEFIYTDDTLGRSDKYYFNQGNLDSSIHTYTLNGSELKQKNVYKYNNSNKKIEFSYFYTIPGKKDYILNHKSTYDYNGENKLARSESFDINGDLLGARLYFYNAIGNHSATKTYNSKYELIDYDNVEYSGNDEVVLNDINEVIYW